LEIWKDDEGKQKEKEDQIYLLVVVAIFISSLQCFIMMSTRQRSMSVLSDEVFKHVQGKRSIDAWTMGKEGKEGKEEKGRREGKGRVIFCFRTSTILGMIPPTVKGMVAFYLSDDFHLCFAEF